MLTRFHNNHFIKFPVFQGSPNSKPSSFIYRFIKNRRKWFCIFEALIIEIFSYTHLRKTSRTSLAWLAPVLIRLGIFTCIPPRVSIINKTPVITNVHRVVVTVRLGGGLIAVSNSPHLNPTRYFLYSVGYIVRGNRS